MKCIYVSRLSVLAFLVSIIFPFAGAVADDMNCIIQADDEKVLVVVWDEDSSGNRQDEIFKGWLDKGERKKIKSSTGFINFSYQRVHSDKSFGDNPRTCENGNTVQIP